MQKVPGCLFILLVSFTFSYAQSGQLDLTFGNGGKVKVCTMNDNKDFYQNGMAVQPDGKIIVVGNSGNADYKLSRSSDVMVIRFHPDGKLDSSFGKNGGVVFDYVIKEEPAIIFSDYSEDVAIAPDGKIVIVGYTSHYSTYYIIVIRLNTNGSRDLNFGNDGIKLINLSSGGEIAGGLSILPSGRILIAAYTYGNTVSGFTDLKVIQLKQDGQLDEEFGVNGITSMDFGESESASSMFLQKDGKIVVGGAIGYGETAYRESAHYDYLVARFLPDGKPDLSFSNDGILIFDMGGYYERVTGIAMQQDEKIVVTGIYQTNAGAKDFAVARINVDGTLDPGFDLDGKKIIVIPGNHEQSFSVLVDAKDHILLGGYAGNNLRSNDFAIMKLTPEGNLDARFDEDGKAYVDFSNTNDLGGSIKFQPDGKIVFAGTTNHENVCFGVARILNITEFEPTDVLPTYIGPKILGTPCFGCQTAIVPLRAAVSSVSGPWKDTDPPSGDIRNARAKFVDRDNNVDITGWIPVSKLIDPNDTKTATIDATWYVTLSYDQPVKKVRVGMIVDNGYYIRNDSRDDATITFYIPQDDVVSGGGQLIGDANSKGKYKANSGSVTMFGFYALLKPGMPQPSGHMNMWFSGTNQTGSTVTYQLEINSINGLGVKNSKAYPKHAEFHGTGKLWNRSGPSPMLVEDNVTVQTHLIDGGEWRDRDSLTVNIWSNNNVLLHSSNWIHTKPTPQLLYFGNVTVHSGSSLDESSSALMTKSLIEYQKEKFNQKDLSVTVFNNPTTNQFALKVVSPHADVYSIRVTDISGRTVEARNNVPIGNMLQIGGNYKRGMYFAEIRQGKQLRVVKLVKN